MEAKTQARADRLAVLIDADNASAKLIEPLLKEIAKYGTANVKRIYEDWTKPHLNSWKDKLNEFAIQPIQQFNYTNGKNSTDSALIIDAMDLLYAQNFDGFCIVSSDSDFTRLACRIREAGLVIYGFGENKTPEPVGAQLTKLSPSFDSRNYGYKKLGDLIRAVNLFEIKETPHQKNPVVKDLQIKLTSIH